MLVGSAVILSLHVVLVELVALTKTPPSKAHRDPRMPLIDRQNDKGLDLL